MTSQIRSRVKLYTFSEVLTLKAPNAAAPPIGGGQNRLHNWVLTLFAYFNTAGNYSFQWEIETRKRKIVNSISTLITPPAIVTHYVHTIASSPSREGIRGLSVPDEEVSRRDEGEIEPVTNLSSLIAQSLSNLSEGEDAVVLALASYKCGEGGYPVRGTRRAHLC